MSFACVGMFNGMMGFDPTTALAGGESDSDMAEKLSQMAALSMGAGMSGMEDMQLHSKLLEMYGQAAMGQPSTSTSVAKEPGERSPTPSASHHHHRKAATITKPSTHDSDNAPEDDQPEDLSIKSRADGDTHSQCHSSDGRLSSASCHQELGEKTALDRSDTPGDRESQLSTEEQTIVSPPGTDEKQGDTNHPDAISSQKLLVESSVQSPASASTELAADSVEPDESEDRAT